MSYELKDRVQKIVAIFLAAITIALLGVLATGCEHKTQTGNRIIKGQDIQTFHYAYVRLGDKDIVEGYITQWRDYNNGDEIQLMIDGKYYLTHYSNVVMISDPAMGGMVYGAETRQDGGVISK